MAQSTTKKKPVGKLIVMGIISIALYTTLLLKQDLVNSTFAQGGMYALLPIVTAFVFSFIHGSFTGHFWTVLGIEAAKKKKEVK
jgi:F0F1-type ATP synthase assembly protein I